MAAVRGWPHRDTLPLLWTAWQAGGPAWLVTADLATVPGQERDGPAVTRPTSAGHAAAARHPPRRRRRGAGPRARETDGLARRP